MWPSLKPSQRMAVVGSVPPQSATVVQTTGWIDVSNYQNFLAIIMCGAFSAGALIDATVQQATSAGGAGAKALAVPLAITELTAASGAGNQVLINFHQDLLDVNNGYRYIQFSVTPSVAAALVSMVVLGVDFRNGPADQFAATSQVQVIG